MHTLTLFSPAKINLFLHITGRQANGYHTLQSVFRTLDFGDTLHFESADTAASDTTTDITTDTTTVNLPLVQLIGAEGLTDNLADNLISKAAHTLAKQYPSHARPITITLDKKIPTGAGLGGGSSNCATTLIALNTLWQLNLTPTQLITIATSLGADVPFFVFSHFISKSAIAEGIGEILTPIDLPPCHYLLLTPHAHVSTHTLFAHPKLCRDHPSHAHSDIRATDLNRPTDSLFINAFEPLVAAQSPAVRDALAYLTSLSPHTHTIARMTGTGSVVFLPLPSLPDQHTLQQWQQNAPCPSIIAKGL